MLKLRINKVIMKNMSSKEVGRWYWFVNLLPKSVIYFCFMHVMVYSTTGKYSDTIVPDLTGMDAIKRYTNDCLRVKK